jgi:hypothetical protein
MEKEEKITDGMKLMNKVIRFLRKRVKKIKINELLENIIDQLKKDREDGISLRTSCETLVAVFGFYTAHNFFIGAEKKTEACAAITILATKILEMIDMEDWDYDDTIEFLEKTKQKMGRIEKE